MDFRVMKPEERNYTYSQSQQISMQTGCIGHLRADMDSNGEGFFSSWDDFRKDLKTQEFKDEFDAVINELRKDGGIFFTIAVRFQSSAFPRRIALSGMDR
jgi:hypothetical protein